jgi:hypothetical protein
MRGPDVKHAEPKPGAEAAPPIAARPPDALARYADPGFSAWLGRADGPARAQAVHQLQRTVGNRRTGELLAAATPGRPLLQRNPIAGAAGAIEVVAGLAQTASFAGDAINYSSGGLSYTSPTAQRLSEQTQPRKALYRTECLWMASLSDDFEILPVLAPAADAHFDIEWEGNDYGEIGAARVRLNLDKSEKFSWSSGTVHFDVAQNLVQEGGDRRSWQMHWIYEGTYDPFGSGEIDFQGKFAIDAFGNFIPLEHESHQRSTFNVECEVVPGTKLPTKPVPPLPKGPAGAPAGGDED